MVFPCILAAYVYTLPESPRWLLQKARQTGNHKKYEAAFTSLMKLRCSKIQAARDLITINHLLDNDDVAQKQPGWRIKKLFTVRRNRRALTASLILMFFQQFCGVNVPILYSTTIFNDANFSIKNSLLVRNHSLTYSPDCIATFIDILRRPWVLALLTSWELCQHFTPLILSADEVCYFGPFHSWRFSNSPQACRL